MADITPQTTKVLSSPSAPGTSRRSVLRDDDKLWTALSTPAYLTLVFPSPLEGVGRVALEFQGGFVATAIGLSARMEAAGEAARDVEGEGQEGDWESVGKVFPEDTGRRQVFEITIPRAMTQLRLDLERSSDNQGRVTLYRLELLS